ncbi:hypothetical protein EON65_31270 [archaeon]|nr:MAG: hypothetical protein EON65_31270 [archaeon]
MVRCYKGYCILTSVLYGLLCVCFFVFCVYVYTLTLFLHVSQERGEYSLILTGHSLGAGVAVLLALLLKDAFPSLRCFAYGAPGALTDILTARGSQ